MYIYILAVYRYFGSGYDWVEERVGRKAGFDVRRVVS